MARFGYGSVFPEIGKEFPRIVSDLEWHDFLEEAILEFCSGKTPMGMKM
jgi:hypothetical protein